MFALPTLSPIVLAVPPLYVPEKVKEESVAERLAKLEPSEIPEMVEFCSWLLPIVEVATTVPTELTESKVFERPVTANPPVERAVVVALVPVALVKVKVERVDEAGARKPLRSARVVEVDCSLVPSLVKGKAKVIEAR